jgi:hypothetical protein
VAVVRQQHRHAFEEAAEYGTDHEAGDAAGGHPASGQPFLGLPRPPFGCFDAAAGLIFGVVWFVISHG